MTPRQRLEAWATGHPLDLAIFRVTVALVVLGSVDVWDAHLWAQAAVAPPVGWGLVSAVLPVSVDGARLATALAIASTALTLVGAWTRWASRVAVLSLAWLLAVPQHSGQVLHTHHLVWFFALVAAGPSGDALSVDAWWRRRHGERGASPSLAHGVPVRLAWLVVGAIFFFPGAWKLLAGPVWLEGLPALVEWKRFQLGLGAPGPLPSHWLRAGGQGAIFAELCIGALVLSRRTRALGVGLALAFHAAVQVVMGISFSSLWACYAVFGDWARWLGRAEPSAPPDWRSARASLLVGGLLLAAMLGTGLVGREDAWPVACYPTFRQPAPEALSWVEIEALDGAGRATPVLNLEALRRPGAHRWWGLVPRVAQDPSPERLTALHRQWAGADALPAARYVVATWRPTEPTRVSRREIVVLPVRMR